MPCPEATNCAEDRKGTSMTDEELEVWLDEEWEEFLSKPNRRKERERKIHSVVQGAPVPDGSHQSHRKDKDRRRNEAIRRAKDGS